MEFPDFVFIIPGFFDEMQDCQVLIGDFLQIAGLLLELFLFLQPGLDELVAGFKPGPNVRRHVQGSLELKSGLRRNSLPPLMISLTAWTGRPSRLANSAWVIPLTAITSARYSPGGMGRSE